MFDKDMIVKLGDYDLEYFIEMPFRYDPTKWNAPESLKPMQGASHFLGKSTIKSDRWSYGIFLNELFNFGEEPFGKYLHADIRGCLKDREDITKYLETKKIPNQINELVAKLLNYDPDQRPDFPEILEHLTNEPIKENTSTLVYQPTTTAKRVTVVFENHNYTLYVKPDTSIKSFKTTLTQTIKHIGTKKDQSIHSENLAILEVKDGKPIVAESKPFSLFFPGGSVIIFAVRV